jgi:hypothetical protein
VRALDDIWDDYWTEVGNETWLYARELIELSPAVRAHFASFIDPCGVNLDWSAAAAAADEWPASSTERRLLALVLSLVNPDEEHGYVRRRDEAGSYEVPTVTGTRMIDARALGSMGSWAADVASILARYITGQRPRGVR